MPDQPPNSHSQVFESIPQMLEKVSNAYPEKTALDEEGRPSLSYQELHQRVGSLSLDLRRAGVQKEDRVAVVVPNGRDMAVVMLAVCSASVAAPLNPAYQESEFADYFKEIRVSFLVLPHGMTSPARALAEKLGVRVLELTKDAISILSSVSASLTDQSPPSGVSPARDDLALILLTSGSTGRSKKVPLTHRNLCVSVRDICRVLELTPNDRCLCMWEQFHIGGLVDLLLVPLASGGSVICTKGFDAEKFFELVNSEKPTWYQGVPATVHELMAYARKQGITGVESCLRLVRVTASALSPKLMEELEHFFHVPVITTFGMTEASPLITTNLLPPHVRKPGSTGPSCGPEIAIMDEDGRTLETGEVGEVLIRGENIMSGYEDAPEANLRSFRDGWFRTGDIGCLDEDGYLFLRGRIKETINRGGEKITPQEIDDVLLTHPEIAEAICFHIPHRVLGEDIAAAIVLHRSGSMSEKDVRDYVATHMVEFKVPRKVVFVEGFERNVSGKVNRSTLAEIYGLLDASDYEPPSSPMETTLAEIWKRELSVEKVGRNDSFSELGGDSLSSMRMIVELEKRLGGRLPMEVLGLISIGATPLHEVATALEKEGIVQPVQITKPSHSPDPVSRIPLRELSEEDRRAMLVVMGSGTFSTWKPLSLVKVANRQGSRRPIFWVFNSPHAEMKGLVEAFGADQPIFGLYSGSTTVDPERLPDVSDHYVQEILEIQPEGPLIIAGNCRGARAAVRIATRLREFGREVSHMCILEMFDRALYDFEGKQLLLFGKQSSEFRYRDFNFMRPGWKLPFRNPPRVEWIEGRHARFFTPENVGSMAEKLKAFLGGEPEDLSPVTRLRTHLRILIHRIPPAFNLYVRLTSRN